MLRRERVLPITQTLLRNNGLTGSVLARASVPYFSSTRMWYATEAAAQPAVDMPSKKERRAELALKKMLKRQARAEITKEADEERARKKEQAQFEQNVKAVSARLNLSEELVQRALTHPSWSLESNQRVEFLGMKQNWFNLA